MAKKGETAGREWLPKGIRDSSKRASDDASVWLTKGLRRNKRPAKKPPAPAAPSSANGAERPSASNGDTAPVEELSGRVEELSEELERTRREAEERERRLQRKLEEAERGARARTRRSKARSEWDAPRPAKARKRSPAKRSPAKGSPSRTSTKAKSTKTAPAKPIRPASSAPKRRRSRAKPGLNDVSFEELREIGLSVTQSARLIGYRDLRGGFKSIDQLDELPGFPEETIAALKRGLKKARGSQSAR